jgi:hypothetical protein
MGSEPIEAIGRVDIGRRAHSGKRGPAHGCATIEPRGFLGRKVTDR